MVMIPLAASACEIDAIRITSSNASTTGPRSSGSSLVVGQWSRVLLFSDAAGNLQSSETVWYFGSDGFATRTVITRNVAYGFADRIVAQARWSLNGRTILITFLPPDRGSLQFSFYVDDSTLTLDGRDFRRVFR